MAHSHWLHSRNIEKRGLVCIKYESQMLFEPLDQKGYDKYLGGLKENLCRAIIIE